MQKLILFFLMIALSQSLLAQFELSTAGARGYGMGGTSVALDDFWSSLSTISGLTAHSRIKAGIAIQNQYGIKELSMKSIGCIIPIEKARSVLGLHYMHYGTAFYNEQKASLAYALKIAKRFSVGIQLDYLLAKSGNGLSSNKQVVTAETAIQYSINPYLSTTFLIKNPFSVKMGMQEKLPTIMLLGMLYEIEKWQGTVEIEKAGLRPYSFRMGVEYAFYKEMYARTGLSIQPTTYSLGYGIKYQKLNMDIAAQFHSVLGVSPLISVIYAF